MTPAQRWLAVAASAALLALTVSLRPQWWAAWLAPVPILLAVFAARSQADARIVAYLAAVPAYLVNVAYYREIFPLPLVAVLILLQAALWTFTWRAAAAYADDPRWFAVFAYPVTWAACDTLVATLSPHSTAGSPAYSQGDALVPLQVASLAGTPGVVFLISLAASALSLALWRRSARVLLLPGALLAAALVFGYVRLHAPSAAVLTVPVGLAAIDDFLGGRVPPLVADRVWQRYTAATVDLATRGARLIVLPEKIEVFRDAAAAHARLEALAAIARERQVYIVAGIGLPHDGALSNRAFLLSPYASGEALYDKHHLVPGLEAEFRPGTRWVTREIAGVRYGLAICKDLHFPSTGRAYASLGVDAVLDPAWDFDHDDWMAARLTAVRGIEGGFAIFRSSRQGLLTLTDRRGRILAETRSAALPGALLLHEAGIEHGAPTFYAQYGDVFGWAMVVSAIALRLLRRPRP